MEYGNSKRRGGGRFGQRRSFGNRGGFSPVKVGEELDVRIEAVGAQGDGIAKKNGFVLFVPGTKEGDNVRVRVTKVSSKVGFAEVIGEGSSANASGEYSEEATESYTEKEDSEEF
ncbi:MAG: TRAM domain-containing protein [Candidatus Woesearchaeota archaeon]